MERRSIRGVVEVLRVVRAEGGAPGAMGEKRREGGAGAGNEVGDWIDSRLQKRFLVDWMFGRPLLDTELETCARRGMVAGRSYKKSTESAGWMVGV